MIEYTVNNPDTILTDIKLKEMILMLKNLEKKSDFKYIIVSEYMNTSALLNNDMLILCKEDYKKLLDTNEIIESGNKKYFMNIEIKIQ